MGTPFLPTLEGMVLFVQEKSSPLPGTPLEAAVLLRLLADHIGLEPEYENFRAGDKTGEWTWNPVAGIYYDLRPGKFPNVVDLRLRFSGAEERAWSIEVWGLMRLLSDRTEETSEKVLKNLVPVVLGGGVGPTSALEA